MILFSENLPPFSARPITEPLAKVVTQELHSLNKIISMRYPRTFVIISELCLEVFSSRKTNSLKKSVSLKFFRTDPGNCLSIVFLISKSSHARKMFKCGSLISTSSISLRIAWMPGCYGCPCGRIFR